MSGGTINVINRNTGATQVDYDVLAITTNVTGGLLVIGATGAPAGTTSRPGDNSKSDDQCNNEHDCHDKRQFNFPVVHARQQRYQ